MTGCRCVRVYDDGFGAEIGQRSSMDWSGARSDFGDERSMFIENGGCLRKRRVIQIGL